jgi:hypothetical protein
MRTNILLDGSQNQNKIFNMENLQYPIGRFSYQPYDETQRRAHIETIRNLPVQLREAATMLSSAQLEQPFPFWNSWHCTAGIAGTIWHTLDW